MNNTKHQIFRLNKKDVHTAVDALCESFFNYPVMRFIIDSESNYRGKLKTLINFFVMARVLRGEAILGIGTGTDIHGVALISNPENTTNPPELNDLRNEVWSELGAESRARYQKFSDTCAQFQVDTPHIHLNMIGIRSVAQGTGLGRRLIEQVHLLSMNDPNSGGVTLTTEDADKVSFYEHLEYKIIGEAEFGPGLKTWSFFRPD